MKTTNQKPLLIIVPSYNEAKNLTRLIHEIKSINFVDLLIVDDSSTDNSCQIYEKELVQVIYNNKNLGVIKSVYNGLKWAKKHNYQYVLRLDGDGQHNPIYAKKMLNVLINQKKDLIIGSRFLKKTHYHVPFERKVAINYLRYLLKFFKLKIEDPTSGMWLINQKTYNYILQKKLNNYFEPALLVELILHGFKHQEISVDMRKRRHGHSFLNLFNGSLIIARLNWQIIRIFFQHKISYYQNIYASAKKAT